MMQKILKVAGLLSVSDVIFAALYVAITAEMFADGRWVLGGLTVVVPMLVGWLVYKGRLRRRVSFVDEVHVRVPDGVNVGEHVRRLSPETRERSS